MENLILLLEPVLLDLPLLPQWMRTAPSVPFVICSIEKRIQIMMNAKIRKPNLIDRREI
jgi:hypothetical protein